MTVGTRTVENLSSDSTPTHSTRATLSASTGAAVAYLASSPENGIEDTPIIAYRMDA